jgi:hypothetical protein
MTLEEKYFVAQIMGGTASLLTACLTIWMYVDQKRSRSKLSRRRAALAPVPQIPATPGKEEGATTRSRSRGGFAPLLRWLLFTMLITLLPVMFIATNQVMVAQPVSIDSLFSRGELLLISTALCAASITRLVVRPHPTVVAIVVAGSCMLLLFVSSTLYAAVVTSAQHGIAGSLHSVAVQSIFIFVFTLIASASATLLAGSYD